MVFFCSVLFLFRCVCVCSHRDFVETDNHSDSSPCAFMWIVYLAKFCWTNFNWLFMPRRNYINLTECSHVRCAQFYVSCLMLKIRYFSCTRDKKNVSCNSVRFLKSFQKVFNLLRSFFSVFSVLFFSAFCSTGIPMCGSNVFFLSFRFGCQILYLFCWQSDSRR